MRQYTLTKRMMAQLRSSMPSPKKLKGQKMAEQYSIKTGACSGAVSCAVVLKVSAKAGGMGWGGGRQWWRPRDGGHCYAIEATDMRLKCLVVLLQYAVNYAMQVQSLCSNAPLHA